jgi:hypothetical protein
MTESFMINQNTIVNTFNVQHKKRKVLIVWDMGNVQVPSHMNFEMILETVMRKIENNIGEIIEVVICYSVNDTFNKYKMSRAKIRFANESNIKFREINTVKENKTDIVMVTDIMKWHSDMIRHQNSQDDFEEVLILISGDSDFIYPIENLIHDKVLIGVLHGNSVSPDLKETVHFSAHMSDVIPGFVRKTESSISMGQLRQIDRYCDFVDNSKFLRKKIVKYIESSSSIKKKRSNKRSPKRNEFIRTVSELYSDNYYSSSPEEDFVLKAKSSRNDEYVSLDYFDDIQEDYNKVENSLDSFEKNAKPQLIADFNNPLMYTEYLNDEVLQMQQHSSDTPLAHILNGDEPQYGGYDRQNITTFSLFQIDFPLNNIYRRDVNDEFLPDPQVNIHHIDNDEDLREDLEHRHIKKEYINLGFYRENVVVNN